MNIFWNLTVSIEYYIIVTGSIEPVKKEGENLKVDIRADSKFRKELFDETGIN